MEDIGKTLHHNNINNNNNNNLLHLLSLDPNSSSSTSHLLHDADTLLGFFNHPLLNTNTFSAATPAPFSEISPSCSADPPTGFGIDHRHSHLPKSNPVMGGKRRKMTTTTTTMTTNKKGEAAMEKLPREVIHVRAKRGQATDSHSLAERVRRERINEKLKVLQDLVPGCYKTMGMAVMLDVIINYVQSLQNQIEFLSMKLSAASMFYDFNSPEAEAMEALQRTNPIEAREMERMMRDEGFDQGFASSDPPPPPNSDHDLHSTWPF